MIKWINLNFSFCFTLICLILFIVAWQFMWRAKSLELLPFDPEIERTLWELRRERWARRRAMAEWQKKANINNNNNQQQNLWDYFMLIVNDNYSEIWRQTINANKFVLKPTFISMVQQNQYGVHRKKTLTFIFQCFWKSIILERWTEWVMMLFSCACSHSLLGTRCVLGFKVCHLEVLPNGRTLAHKFLTKFFPPSKTAEEQNCTIQIIGFWASLRGVRAV